MKSFELPNGRVIGGSSQCYIIAEIGQNHQGNINIAKQLIAAAKDAGVDCVKFQKSNLSEKFNGAALSRPYTSKNSWGSTYGEHKRYLEFSEDDFRQLQHVAHSMDLDFSASGMDMASVDFLDSLEVPFFKVASNDVDSIQYMTHVAQKNRPLLVSSGMQSLETMIDVYNLLKTFQARFCFMQCTSSYPTAPKDVHLNVIKTYQEKFPDTVIGYSGHEEGISISVAAVALGAKVVERHFTLDKSMKGSDHKSSLNPTELKELVKQIRIVETALGSPQKIFRDCEWLTYSKLGKTLVAKVDIQKGQRLSWENICAKVADLKGIRSKDMKVALNCQVRRDVKQDETIFEEDIISN